MNNIFQIIEDVEEEKFVAEFESIKNEILGNLSNVDEEITFESIIKGDNFIKSAFSKIFKNIFNINRSTNKFF